MFWNCSIPFSHPHTQKSIECLPAYLKLTYMYDISSDVLLCSPLSTFILNCLACTLCEKVPRLSETGQTQIYNRKGGIHQHNVDYTNLNNDQKMFLFKDYTKLCIVVMWKKNIWINLITIFFRQIKRCMYLLVSWVGNLNIQPLIGINLNLYFPLRRYHVECIHQVCWCV